MFISVENPEPLQKIDDYPDMRRTASLDAIYLKGLWPKGTVDYGSNLPLDKATQTPEEWMVDLKRYSLSFVFLSVIKTVINSFCFEGSPTEV